MFFICLIACSIYVSSKPRWLFTIRKSLLLSIQVDCLERIWTLFLTISRLWFWMKLNSFVFFNDSIVFFLLLNEQFSVIFVRNYVTFRNETEISRPCKKFVSFCLKKKLLKAGDVALFSWILKECSESSMSWLRVFFRDCFRRTIKRGRDFGRNVRTHHTAITCLNQECYEFSVFFVFYTHPSKLQIFSWIFYFFYLIE